MVHPFLSGISFSEKGESIMLQVYSDNIVVPANSAIPLNNVKIRKGCTAVNSAPSTIQLNKRGVYVVNMDAFGEAAAAGDITIQMFRNGVADPSAVSTVTGAVGEIDTLHFETLVQVSEDNTPCCCTAPTEIRFETGDVGINGLHINAVVTKLC
jgi:hypothetical protein